MALQGDIAQMLCGLPIVVQGCKIAVTQPTVKDVCGYGEDNFLTVVKVLTDTENIVKPIKEGNPQLAMLSDFQLLIVMLNEDAGLKELIFNFFELVFPQYDIEIDNGSINFRIEGSPAIIGQLNPMNFSELQLVIKELFLPNEFGNTDPEYNPANEAAAEIAKKLQKGRQMRDKMKVEKEGKQSLFGTYASVLAIGNGENLNTYLEYTPFQLYDAFKRYSAKIASDLYQKVATTPLMDVSKMTEPENWMGNIYNN